MAPLAPPDLTVRLATADDAPILAQLVGELAAYERREDENRCTPEALRAEMTAGDRVLEAVLAFVGSEPVGMAGFFQTYSTFAARRGLYLEDLYVREAWRHRGVGAAILRQVAQVALGRDLGRVEWTTLIWNTAAIEFYEALGATPNAAWTTYRLTGAWLQKVAQGCAMRPSKQP
jgi:GNAT superfamily N-acetyltransferase